MFLVAKCGRILVDLPDPQKKNLVYLDGLNTNLTRLITAARPNYFAKHTKLLAFFQTMDKTTLGILFFQLLVAVMRSHVSGAPSPHDESKHD